MLRGQTWLGDITIFQRNDTAYIELFQLPLYPPNSSKRDRREERGEPAALNRDSLSFHFVIRFRAVDPCRICIDEVRGSSVAID